MSEWPLFSFLLKMCFKVFTENYNGFFNAYVPERRVEVKQVDQIRYSILFHNISENDTGVYTCKYVNQTELLVKQ